jgi:glycosyltransferase involved in cell wall biosynthesis
MVIFGPDSVHTHRWADYVRGTGWDVTWIAYGEHARDAMGVIPEVALETGGHLAFWRTLVDLFRSSRRFRRMVRRFEPDLVQTHWLLGPAWIAALAGRHPIVATAWGSDVLLPFPGRRAARFLTRTLGRRLDAVTYSSQALERGLLENGLRPERLHRVLHGVDRTHFRPLPADPALLKRLGAPTETPVILSPRGITPVYAPETVLRAFAQVVDRVPCTLLMRVPTDQTEEWARLRATLAPDVVARIVTFSGVEHDAFPRLLASSDMVISMSRSEGAAITVMETLLCERPLIVSDIPQNREWVQDDRFGTIVPVGDAVALAAAIENVLADSEGAARKARDAALALPALADGPEEALRLYASLLAEPVPRR